MQALKRLAKAPYFLSLVRIAGHYGLAITAFLVPELGENRMIVAGLIAFVIAPVVFLSSLKFNSLRSARVDPFVDLIILLIVVAFLPELWHLALLIGLVCALAPSMAIGPQSYRYYAASSAILVIGMLAIAVMRNVENWQLSILVLVAIYPAVVLYSFLQTKRMEEVTEKADALSALQLLAGGVAHDFNNILTGISGYAEFARSSGYEPQATERALEKIIESSQRAGLLSRQLMSFSNENKVEPTAVDLVREVNSVADMLATTMDAGITIAVDVPEKPVMVLGELAGIHQILLNLMVNAVEATKSPGTISVKVSQTNDLVQVEVADNGEGVPNSIRDKLFQPFVTSKASGHGLGLAVVKNVVDEHNGTVEFISNVGVGARFVVRLPVAAAHQVIHDNLDEVKAYPDANTILVADDEMPIRVILRQVLEMEGYQVLDAEDGNQCLELFAEHRCEICAVVLDIKMPGRTGWQCLDDIRRVAPNLPALIISGYDPEGPTIERPDHALKFLAKPFRIAEVKKAIHELQAPVTSKGKDVIDAG